MIPQKELTKRIHNMHRLGLLRSGEAPTVWQVEQAGWVMQPGITRVRPQVDKGFDTWWSQMPQRLFLQALTGSGSVDGTGFARDTNSQIWHILTIYHKDIHGFGYDLEMLTGHDRGLEKMYDAITRMMDGSHPFAWLARQIVGSDEYWQNVKAATEQFLDGDFSFNGPRVQAIVDLALSFPLTWQETLANPAAMRRHTDVIRGLVENGMDLLQYSLGYRDAEDYPTPVVEDTPQPLAS